MGLADTLGAEDRVPVKYSDFLDMARGLEQVRLIKNALACDIPYAQIRGMLTGKNDELEAYRKTGLTPDKIHEIDTLYSELAREKAELKAELEKTKVECEELKETVTELVNMKPGCGVGEATPGDEESGEDPGIDVEQIMKLKAEGWFIKDIAATMGLTMDAVSKAICDERKKTARKRL